MIVVRLQELMNAKGIKTQAEVVEGTGVHRHTVENILAGDTDGMSFDVLNAFCEFFKTEPGNVLKYVPVKNDDSGK